MSMQYHLRFAYNDKKGGYECVDLGSRNGTLMNGKRISNAKQESEAVLIIHGCQIQLSQTKLLCHVHDGHITCRECEPGLIQVQTPVTESLERSNTLNHKQELKKIKKRYGLADESGLLNDKEIKSVFLIFKYFLQTTSFHNGCKTIELLKEERRLAAPEYPRKR